MTKRVFTDSEEKEISKIYSVGHSSGQIAKAYNKPTWNIKSALRRQKTKMRSRTPHFRYHFNQYSFDVIDTEHKAYWLGFIYADGCIHKNIFSVYLSIKDSEHLANLKNFLQAKHPIHFRKHTGFDATSTRVIFRTHNKHFAHRLQQLGIISGRNNFDLVKGELPDNLYSHFIRGYLDGDGCIRGNYNPSVTFVGQLDILKWIREIFHKNLNTNPNLSINEKKNIHVINYCGINQSTLICQWLYQNATIWLQRKKEKFDNWPEPKGRRRIKH